MHHAQLYGPTLVQADSGGVASLAESIPANPDASTTECLDQKESSYCM
jgi:hypothetical protein